jgi:spore maturation protein CgeB
MKILIVDTYYPAFLAHIYTQKKWLYSSNYQTQLRTLLDSCFGTSDFYSRHLNKLGCEAQDLVVNCQILQQTWAKENQIPFSRLILKTPQRLFRLPMLGKILNKIPGLMDIAIAQIKNARPDILYCQDLSFFPGEVVRELKQHVRLIVGQIAYPLPSESFVKGYDLILTSFPHFVDQFRRLGVESEYFRIGFDERVLLLLGDVKKDIDFSFVGGISSHHSNAISLLAYLSENTPLRIFGYGIETLPSHSRIRKRHEGEVWGQTMYQILARSNITLNRHIDVAQNYANNMRLFEATGIGTMLLTDRKDNLSNLFEIGREVITYTSKEEAAELVSYYLDHPKEAEQIAKAGQARTLREHTYALRMQELVSILRKYMA